MVLEAQLFSKKGTTGHDQRGFVALLLLVMIGFVAMTAMTANLWGTNPKELERAKTRAALAQAKAAVLAYVELGNDPTSDNLFDGVNGRLPCPNLNGDGTLVPPCGKAGLSQLGLVPWKTLGIEPPRDAANECLWLAVAGAFKIAGVTSSTNADSNGVFSVIQPVKPAVGAKVWTERLLVATTTAISPSPNMAVAVIMAPGTARARQTRTSTSTQRCPLTTPASATASAPNYLDSYTPSDGKKLDNSTVPPTVLTPKIYVQADIDHELLNDELIWITADEFARAASRRALRVVAGAINNFVYGDALTKANPLVPLDFYPWPAKSPGGKCDSSLLHGFVPSYCGTTEGLRTDWNIGQRMNVKGKDNDPEHWLSQIHYAVADHCVKKSSLPHAAAPCPGGSNRLQVGNDTQSIQALLLIRGRNNAVACPTVAATDATSAPYPSPTLMPCIDPVNQAAITNVATSNLNYVLPLTNSNNQMHLFRGRP